MSISKEQMAELAGVAGEQRSKGPRFEADTIEFDGKKGELRIRKDDGTLIPVNMPAEFVILKKRSVLKAFPMFSTEYDYTSTIINLFSFEDRKTKHVATGTPAQLRAQFPTLKWVQLCYALYEGKVYKLEIKGKSVSSFIEFSDKMKPTGMHSYQYVTIVPSTTSEKNGAIEYKFMNFDQRDLEPEEFEVVKTELARVTEELYNIDKFYAEKKASAAEGVDALPVEDLPLAEEFDAGPPNEVNPDDIPF